MGKQNEGLNIEDNEEELDTEGAEQEEEGSEADRGDDLHPEDKDTKGLAAVAGGEEEEEEPEEEEQAGGRIPKGRFNEVNERRIRAEERARVLEEELARVRGGSQGGGGKKEEEAPAFDYDAKEAEYADAMMEGDKDKALKLRKEINAQLRADAEAEATAKAEQRIMQREAEREFKTAVAAAIEKYPFLDAKSKQANADAIDDVVALRDHYIRKGKSPGDALRMAADKIGPQYGKPKKASTQVEEEEEEEGAEDEAPASKSNVTKLADKLKARQQAALTRNAKASAAQPAAISGVGAGSRTKKGEDVDVENLSESEFERMPESEKKRLRGD